MGIFGLAMALRKTILALVSLAGLMGSWSIFDALDGQTLQGTWTMKSPLPAVRAEVAAVALDGKLHALGGSLDGKAGSYHDEYDPATDRWLPSAPLPGPRDHLAVAAA